MVLQHSPIAVLGLIMVGVSLIVALLSAPFSLKHTPAERVDPLVDSDALSAGTPLAAILCYVAIFATLLVDWSALTLIWNRRRDFAPFRARQLTPVTWGLVGARPLAGFSPFLAAAAPAAIRLPLGLMTDPLHPDRIPFTCSCACACACLWRMPWLDATPRQGEPWWFSASWYVSVPRPLLGLVDGAQRNGRALAHPSTHLGMTLTDALLLAPLNRPRPGR